MSRVVLIFLALTAGTTAATWSQVVKPGDFAISDSSSARLSIRLGEVEAVAFETSLYGVGAVPGRLLLASFENAYRQLRDLAVDRHDRTFANVDSANHESILESFARQPENLLAFTPDPAWDGVVRQYFRDQTDSTDYLYVHFLEASRVGSGSDTDWRNAHVFLEGGGPTTHRIRFDVLTGRIDRVAVNWYD